MNCRYCNKPIGNEAPVIVHAYWNAYQLLPNGTIGNPAHYAHERCRKDGFSSEVLECQNIDADCNDCGHFVRGKKVGSDIFEGHCKKLDKRTVAQPNKCTMHPCFEHRKTLNPLLPKT